MNIREFSLNLQKVYTEMSSTFTQYQLSTGLHCLSECGRCCQNPEVESSPLEMIPLALKLYDEGKAEEFLNELKSTTQNSCLLFQDLGEGKGFCKSYSERPVVCRVFGVAAVLDKNQKPRLSVCKYIKEKHQTLPEITESTPMISDWASRLSSLDPELLKEKYPNNIALEKALEKVLLHSQYAQI